MLPNNKKKRSKGHGDDRPPKKTNEDPIVMETEENETDLVFEDPFGDEYDEDDVEAAETLPEGANEDEMDDEEREEENEDEPVKPPNKVWLPSDSLEEGDTLEYDPSAYIMYHALNTEWPCLSFDFIRDNLGDGRLRFPLTMYAVTGSQADRADKNKLTLLKLSDLHKTQVKNESDSESEDDDDNDDDDPVIEHININHPGAVNRLRVMPQSQGITASMSDSSAVHIYDLSTCAKSMMHKSSRSPPPSRSLFSFRGHHDEGFALDWSPVTTGQLVTGDCSGNIHVWSMEGSESGSGGWKVDNKIYKGHKDSVEDLQWSPQEATVFSSCSSDKSVKIWDTRAYKPQISMIDIHTQDVNVMSWNSHVSYLLATGSDDGSFKVWDLRSASSSPSPLAHFTYHKGPITSLEWAHHDESVICVSSEDDQVTVWDLSVEPDNEASPSLSLSAQNELSEIFPPQLLFIHQGQKEVKELHFHPQIPGVVLTTASDGLNVFKPAITAS